MRHQWQNRDQDPLVKLTNPFDALSWPQNEVQSTANCSREVRMLKEQPIRLQLMSCFPRKISCPVPKQGNERDQKKDGTKSNTIVENLGEIHLAFFTDRFKKKQMVAQVADVGYTQRNLHRREARSY